MPPVHARFPRNESAFHQNLTKEDREELLNLQTLREIPKARYATESCLTVLPNGRGRRVVYSHIEIYKMVEEIATDLREAGVRPQTVCAFALHNCVEAVVYFQALMWIGAIALPIDPSLSEQDITAILKDAQAFTIVSAFVEPDDQADDELFQKIRKASSSLHLIEWHISRSINQGVFLERNGIRAGEGAAWSGGAGDFKFDPSEIAVRHARLEGNQTLVFDVSHRRIASATREFAKIYSLTAEMTTLLTFPLHSIQGLMSALATMYSGGNIVVPTGSTIDAKTVLKHTTEQGVQWFSSDPDTILGVYDEISNNPSVADKIKLCFIRSLGKNIESDTMRTIEPILRAPVLEAYGSAETCALISANEDFDFRPGTFGKAVASCTVVILNSAGEKAPAGTVGNIAVRGDHVLRSYNNNDHANELSFIEVAEGDATKQYFLTGDEGSLSTDGYLKVTTLGLLRRSKPDFDIAAEEAKAAQLAALQAAEALRLEEERRKAEELKKMEEEEAAKFEEERKAREAARLKEEHKAEELRQMHEREAEARRLKEEKTRSVTVMASTEGNEDSGIEEQENVSKSQEDAVASRSVSISATSIEDGLNSEMLDRIMERLDEIERNQHRLEYDIEAAHRLEMEKLRELFDKMLESQKPVPDANAAVNIDMEVINSAVKAAAASAESSSRDTEAAAKAAREAADAAAMAAAASRSPTAVSSNTVEVVDPESIQKTVLVSLEEVEEAMKMHPAVAMARAFGRPDMRYGTEVFCAINPKKGARVSEPWLKLHAQSVLPAAFVPKKFFYKADLTGTEKREALAQDTGLLRLSHYAGFRGGTKVVKAPQWSPKQAETPTA